jgi:hypothetical protein
MSAVGRNDRWIRGGSSRFSRALLGQEDVRRVALESPLPCGMPGCGALTQSALVEPDAELPGIWMLLPICEGCSSATRSGFTRLDDGFQQNSVRSLPT